MANQELALYTVSNSTFNLGEIPQPINPTPKNTYVREEACVVTMAPLAVMPPLRSGASGNTRMWSMARITSLKNKIVNLHEDVRILKGQLDDSNIRVTSLEH